MENYYLLFIVILFALAITDLVVGVSNDAVNFLNSSIGSKAAPFKIIMIVAALGVLVGATFSSGMMEVARKGIFHPEQFYFSEIMVLFLAVMMTDIILLDVFNTYGLPTSTTVSIVFELLGAAVAVSIIKISHADGGTASIATYINSSKALAIISGILISIVVAFTVGAIIQYITRILFSFNYEKSFKYFGALWGGFAFSSITYFILIKGAKGASFITPENLIWIKEHTLMILGLSMLGWTLLFQVMVSFFRVNVLKIIVLVGTFALAMAFAGNDLVNFIGVPLAGYESFKTFLASSQGADQLLMHALSGPVKTPTIFLIAAGFVMVITLWISKKARSVTATTVDLSRQDEGLERFESSFLARATVRQFMAVGNTLKFISPAPVRTWINNRFDRSEYDKLKKEKGVSFDLIRASVNLVVASILIAIGTSFRLPLSTTYVTFMVAMGTSLADRAWGRESAVYRISGVITVVTGWFFTALIAFTIAFVIAFFIYYGKLVAIGILVSFAIYLMIRTKSIHRKREDEKQHEKELEQEEGPLSTESIFNTCRENVLSSLSAILVAYNKSIEGCVEENRKKIKSSRLSIKALNKETKKLKNNVHYTIKRLREDAVESGHYYVQVLDYLRETAHCLSFIADPIFMHIENNHPPLTREQSKDLLILKEEITRLFNLVDETIRLNDYSKINDVLDVQNELLEKIKKSRKHLIKSLKKEALSTKSSMLYLEILNESKNLILFVINLLKAQRDFEIYRDENGN